MSLTMDWLFFPLSADHPLWVLLPGSDFVFAFLWHSKNCWTLFLLYFLITQIQGILIVSFYGLYLQQIQEELHERTIEQNSICPQACEGDTIQVKVENRLDAGEGISIHWHGILQRGSPHMDGVSLITQCPITYSSGFTYKLVHIFYTKIYRAHFRE